MDLDTRQVQVETTEGTADFWIWNCSKVAELAETVRAHFGYSLNGYYELWFTPQDSGEPWLLSREALLWPYLERGGRFSFHDLGGNV